MSRETLDQEAGVVALRGQIALRVRWERDEPEKTTSRLGLARKHVDYLGLL